MSEKLDEITTADITSEAVSLTAQVIDHIITSTINSNLPHTPTVGVNLAGALNNIQGLSQEQVWGCTFVINAYYCTHTSITFCYATFFDE